jgi:hypothetical protein
MKFGWNMLLAAFLKASNLVFPIPEAI